MYFYIKLNFYWLIYSYRYMSFIGDYNENLGEKIKVIFNCNATQQ